MWVVAFCIACSVAWPISADTSCPMREFDNVVIANHNYHEIKRISAEECKTDCQNDATCKSAEYHKAKRRCFLSKKTYESAKKEHLLRTSNAFTMFAVCAPANICDYEIFDKTVIASHNVKPYIKTKMTLDECRTECNSATKYKCSSFEYNRVTQRCFPSEMTHGEAKGQGLVRSLGNFVMYSCPAPTPAPTVPAPNVCDFEIYDNTVIASHNVKPYIKTKMTLDECRNECNSATNYKCSSFEYNRVMNRCFPSEMTHGEAKDQGLVRSSGNFVLYSCPNKAAPTTAAPTPAPTTAAPTPAPTAAAPTPAPTTAAPTPAPTTAAPTTAAPTLAPKTAAPTPAPTTAAPTLAPTTAPPTPAPTTAATTPAPTTAAPTPAPTTPAPTIPIDTSPCTWKTYTGTFILTKDNVIHKWKTVDQCKALCIEATAFKCATFDYFSAKSTCYLSTVSHAEAKKIYKLRSSSLFNLYECIPREFGLKDGLVISTPESPIQEGGLVGFNIETTSAGSAYIQVWRKDAAKKNTLLVYSTKAAFEAAGKHTISFLSVPVIDGDVIGIVSVGSNIIKYSEACSSATFAKDGVSELGVGAIVADDDMYAITCRKYEVTPVLSSAASGITREDGFEVKEQPTLGTESDTIIGLQTSTSIKGGKLVGWKFYAKSTGPMTLLIFSYKVTNGWPMLKLIYKQRVMANKVGVHVVYTLNNIYVPSDSVIGFEIKENEKVVIPYKLLTTCPGSQKFYAPWVPLNRIDNSLGTEWAYNGVGSCRDYAITTIVEFKVKPVGGACNTEEECVDENDRCTNNKCTCINSHYNDAGTCNQKKSLGESCNAVDACGDVYTGCVSAKCSCVSTHFEEDGKCLRTATETFGGRSIRDRWSVDKTVTKRTFRMPIQFFHGVKGSGTLLRFKIYAKETGPVGFWVGQLYNDVVLSWVKVKYISDVYEANTTGIHTIEVPGGLRVQKYWRIGIYQDNKGVVAKHDRSCYTVWNRKFDTNPKINYEWTSLERDFCKDYSFQAVVRYDD